MIVPDESLTDKKIDEIKEWYKATMRELNVKHGYTQKEKTIGGAEFRSRYRERKMFKVYNFGKAMRCLELLLHGDRKYLSFCQDCRERRDQLLDIKKDMPEERSDPIRMKKIEEIKALANAIKDCSCK